MLRYSVTNRHTPKTKFAKTLRKRQTPGEKALWKAIRAKRFHGIKFRRQVPVGPYIADFLCVSKKIIIEIDGDSHCFANAKIHDRKREDYLRSEGFEVLRFGNGQTVESLENVLSQIYNAICKD